MSSLPKISVVIGTLNRAHFLKRMLDNLFQDDYPNLEVIVIDGASQDNTVELLKSYGNRISKWKSEPDPGEYFAYNKGLQMATGEIIKPMTDDDVLRPGVFRLIAKYFAAHPEMDMVFGQTAIWDDRKGVSKLVDETYSTDSSRLALRDWMLGNVQARMVAAFMRKRVFERIGLFATQYSCGDNEFLFRAAARGVRMGLIPETVIDFHITGSGGVSTKKWRLMADSVRIMALYGTKTEVALGVWSNFIVPFALYPLAALVHLFGWHPLQAWQRWRKQRPARPGGETASNSDRAQNGSPR
jgi:glycosyltransferase involved in cell wall biosynthesis